MKPRSRTLAACLATACLAAGLTASSAQADPKPAWLPVAASTPTNVPLGQNEVQQVAVDAEGGTYTLTVNTGLGRVTTSDGSKDLTLTTTAFGSFHVGDAVAITGSTVAPGTTIESISDSTITLTSPVSAGGGVNKQITVTETTAPIDYNAPPNGAGSLAAGLEALPGIGAGDVTVTGGPGGPDGLTPYTVTFGAKLASANLAQMSPASGGLTGGTSSTATVTTTQNGFGGATRLSVYAQNVGGLPSAGTTTLTVTLPAGATTTGAPSSQSGQDGAWSCPGAGAGQGSVTCTNSTVAIGPGFSFYPLRVPINAGTAASGSAVKVEVSGGGADVVGSYEMPLRISSLPTQPGVQSFTAGAFTDEGIPDQRPGAHPYSASAAILVNTVANPAVPAGEPRNIFVDTPPGFFGNPIAAAQCPEDTAFTKPEVGGIACEHASIVANVQVPLQILGSTESQEPSSVFNIEAPYGFPAKFRFLTGQRNIIVEVTAQLRSDEDYGLRIGAFNTPQISPVFGSFFTIWGTPADSSHDSQRCKFYPVGRSVNGSDCSDDGGPPVAFLTSPVDCAEEAARPPVATINVTAWQTPGQVFSNDVPIPPVEGCEDLDFEVEDFSFEPTSAKAADSPASFATELHMPTAGLLDPQGRMNPTIRESVVDLPEGVALNASAADGLAACSFAQIGYLGKNFPRPNEIRFTKQPDNCPAASKIGTGELKSELIEEPLQADLYLAEQGAGNPFGSLFAIYLVIEDPRHGIFIKLPGEVQVNEQTGKQRISFRDLPPLPFTHLKLNLKGGPRSPLATPVVCGNYGPTMTNTPWSAPESGPPLSTPAAFALNQGPNGMPCANSPAERPFDVGLAAGTESVQAGAFAPLNFQITRPDGSQEIDSLAITMPPGLAASLKDVPYCPEGALAAAAASTGKAEQAAPACPAASRLGRTLSGAGSGPSPFYAPGNLYLAGPYKGAPLSVVAITPAVAGPFDLGNVLVRNAIGVDPVTAQVTAISDPIPQILKGVPLRVRDIRVILDRPGFALNPTSCEANAITATLNGNSGAVANLASRFQVGGCENLGFEPNVNLRLIGGTKRGGHPRLHAVVRPRPGDANIKRAAVTLPRSAFLDQSNIRTICTRVQWAADNCPKAAQYGFARAWSPLLDQPLQGPVYLRSSNNELPDLVADLRGPAHQPIKIEAAFRTDSVRGGIRSTIDMAPDAPVSRFVLQMQGGKRKGLIVNSRDICRGTNRANSRMTAHNNRRSNTKPKVHAANCGKARKASKGKAQSHSGLRRAR